MANTPNYTATKEDSRPFITRQNAQGDALDQAALTNQSALAAATTARARYNGVIVSPATATISSGSPTVQLTAVVVAGTGAKGVTWVSSHPARATVNANGLVTRVGAGAVVITATSVENTQFNGIANITVT